MKLYIITTASWPDQDMRQFSKKLFNLELSTTIHEK